MMYGTEIARIILEVNHTVKMRSSYEDSLERLIAIVKIGNEQLKEVWYNMGGSLEDKRTNASWLPYEMELVKLEDSCFIRLVCMYCCLENGTVNLTNLPRLGTSVVSYELNQIFSHNLSTQERKFLKNRFPDECKCRMVLVQ